MQSGNPTTLQILPHPALSSLWELNLTSTQPASCPRDSPHTKDWKEGMHPSLWCSLTRPPTQDGGRVGKELLFSSTCSMCQETSLINFGFGRLLNTVLTSNLKRWDFCLLCSYKSLQNTCPFLTSSLWKRGNVCSSELVIKLAFPSLHQGMGSFCIVCKILVHLLSQDNYMSYWTAN